MNKLDEEQYDRDRAADLERREDLRTVCWWGNGLAKVLLFLSFWLLSTEVIESERWRLLLERAAPLPGFAAAVALLGCVVAGVREARREINPPERGTPESPSYHSAPANSGLAVSAWVSRWFGGHVN
jgi:hypothetical protein